MKRTKRVSLQLAKEGSDVVTGVFLRAFTTWKDEFGESQNRLGGKVVDSLGATQELPQELSV